MSDSDVSSTYMSYYDDISSSREQASDIPSLEANIAEDDQEVIQPPGNEAHEERPDEGAGDYPNEPEQENVMPPEAQQYMGVIICKELNGVRYLGTVVDYNVKRKWFRVEYEDEESEDMDEESVLKYLAKKNQICDQPSGSRSTIKKRRGGSKKNGRGKKKKAASTTRKTRSRNTEEGPYIPLAYRETKKDDYIWYR